MSVDPRRTQPFCDPRCYRECRCSRWPDYKNRFGEYVVPHDEGQEYYEKVLSYGPIAYWPLWETAGATAECLVNPLQNGTAVGVTWNNIVGPDGVYGAPFFDGANDYVTIYSAALDAVFSGAEGTMMIWTRVFNAGVWTDGFTRVCVRLGENANNYVRIRQRVALNNNVAYTYVANGVVEYMPTAGHAETTWIARALTWSASADHVQPYYAGLADGPGSGTLGVYQNSLSNGLCLIGAEVVPPLQLAYGWLAHCAVWNRVLTPAEILALATV